MAIIEINLIASILVVLLLAIILDSLKYNDCRYNFYLTQYVVFSPNPIC